MKTTKGTTPTPSTIEKKGTAWSAVEAILRQGPRERRLPWIARVQHLEGKATRCDQHPKNQEEGAEIAH